MTLICFTSQKGAPGTTLSALADRGGWPTRHRAPQAVRSRPTRRAAALALRYGLGLEPGLVTLAVAARVGSITTLRCGITPRSSRAGSPAVVGPDSPDRAGAALRRSGAIVRPLARRNSTMSMSSSTSAASTPTPSMRSRVAAADLTLMVARPCVEQLQPAAHAHGRSAGRRRPAWRGS